MKTQIAFVLLLLTTAAFADPPLVVHEWGTFTSLQSERGETIGWINTEDEPLPAFTHNLNWQMIVGDATAQRNNFLQQGWPRAHPDVTMRLETPVVYFHPAPGAAPFKVDVSVQFNGGWLTQFFPVADPVKPASATDPITKDTVGGLSWNGVSVGGEGSPPPTDSRVWLAPRKVDAAMLSVGGEAERFLFYRGVGHIDAPIRVRLNKDAYDIYSQLDPAAGIDSLEIKNIWQYEMREDGSCAFRAVKPITLGKTPKIETVIMPPGFIETDFSTRNLQKIRAAIRAAILEQGLFADEADALVNTWEVSYFQSPGVRLLFTIPHEWTDHYLPLKLSVPAEVTRVMVGRIDVVTYAQRGLLREIADSTEAVEKNSKMWKAYEKLGRFRNALVLDEQAHRPTETMKKFIAAYGLEGYGAK